MYACTSCEVAHEPKDLYLCPSALTDEPCDQCSAQAAIIDGCLGN